MKYEVVGQHSVPTHNILRDVVIRLTGQHTSIWYPERLRLVEAVVEVDGKPKRMIFITDNLAWAASSICDLYKARWAIEVFFKEIKQTLQLSDFMGYNENAVRWQIWTALLTYVLLRFIAWKNEWKHTFTRLFTTLRGVVWSWEASLNAVGQHPIRFAYALFRSRHISPDSLQYKHHSWKGKTGNGYSQKNNSDSTWSQK